MKERGTMKNFLTRYLQNMRNIFPALPHETAHQIAFAFLTFKMGLYEDSIERCKKSLHLLQGTPVPSALLTALTILRERSADLAALRVQSSGLPEFSHEERPYLALDIAPGSVDDPTHLTISNSLILLYAVAFITSPDDTQALEEQERYVIQILATYKQLINL